MNNSTLQKTWLPFTGNNFGLSIAIRGVPGFLANLAIFTSLAVCECVIFQTEIALSQVVEEKSMVIDRFVGVNVTNEDQYEKYRQKMIPILESYGGKFMVDVQVSEVLLAPDDAQFNRLFTIRFPDEEAMTQFFSSQEYREVREAFFVPSVSFTAPLAKYKVLPWETPDKPTN